MYSPSDTPGQEGLQGILDYSIKEVSSQEEESGKKICNKCKRAFPLNFNFCPYDGNKLVFILSSKNITKQTDGSGLPSESMTHFTNTIGNRNQKVAEIIVIVHPSNPVRKLSKENLQNLYAGKIRYGNEIGGDQRPVVIVTRDVSSNTYQIFEDLILEPKKLYPGALFQASDNAVVRSVSYNKNAIGYILPQHLTVSVKPVVIDE